MKRIINIITYILIVAFIGGLFLVFQSFPFLYILIFLLLFPFISVFISKYVVNRLDISVDCVKEDIDVNQEFYIIFKINNKTIIPIVDANIYCSYSNMFYDYKENLEISIPVYSKGEQIVKLPVKSDYCGVIDVHIDNVTVWDMLHIWYATCNVSVNNNIILYPVLREGVEVDGNVYVTGNDDTEESHKKGNDFAEISDIREYIPGDSLKDIHWKLSSKKEELMVKEHITMSSKQIAVLVEVYNDKEYVLDNIVDVAYSVCTHLITHNMPFTLYWWSDNIKEMKEKIILNIYDVEDSFKEIFYERPYSNRNIGFSQFKYASERIENIIYVSDNDESNDEIIYRFKNVMVSYKGVC